MIPMLDAAHISFGYGLILVPAYLLLPLPYAAYKAGILLNCALAAGILPLGYGLAREFSDRQSAAVAASVAALYPAVFTQTNYLWTEIPFMFFFLLLAWQTLRVMRQPRATNIALLMVNAIVLYALHERAIAIPWVVGGVLLVLAFRRRIPPPTALLMGTLLIAGFALVWLGDQAFWQLGWNPGDGVTVAGTLGQLGSPAGSLAFLKALALQGWYLCVASMGLAVLALAWLSSPGEWQSSRSQPIPWLLYLVLASTSIFVASAATSLSPYRADQFIYGRYNEGFLLPWLILGTLAALRMRNRGLKLAIVAAVVVALSLFGFAFADIKQWQYLLIFNISTVAAWFHAVQSHWVFMIGAAMVVVSLSWLYHVRRRWAGLLPVFAVFLTVIAVNTSLLQRQNTAITSKTAVGRSLLPGYPVHTVGYDASTLPMYLYFQYEALLPRKQIMLFGPGTDTARPRQKLVIAGPDFARNHPDWNPRLIAREPHAETTYWALP